MAICRDSSILFLRDLGYNVVRHPRVGINPLDLIGLQHGDPLLLGRLDRLITQAASPLPTIATGEVATDIEGQSTSRMKLGVGVSLLGTLVGALGGTLGAGVDYTNARQVSFQYENVEADVADPLAIGTFLGSGDVDVGNPIVREYVLGNGDLYVIYHVVRSNRLNVAFERSAGVGAHVDAGKLQASVGGNVTLDTASAASGRVRFAGDTKLAFGFKCLRVVLDEGELRLFGAKAGSLVLSALDEADGASVHELIGATPGLLDLRTAANVGAHA